MINETGYIAYFEGLATKHIVIRHGLDGRKSFFYIPVAADLTEIDNAIKRTKAVPMLALDALKGNFDDNLSDRHLQTVDGQFTILDKATTGEAATIRTVQDNCLKIGLEVLARMKLDSRGSDMITNGTRFTIHNVQYDPVGPMETNHYGYTFRFTITCPFGFTVDSAIWSDK